MIERLALVLLLSLAAVALYHGLRALHLRRMSATGGHTQPSLLYFRSDTCAVCPTQGRIVDSLAAQWDGRLHVERIDAEREPETAARYAVFSLPTTILVDSDGRVRHVNYGLADASKLQRQLSDVLSPQRLPQPSGGSTVVESA